MAQIWNGQDYSTKIHRHRLRGIVAPHESSRFQIKSAYKSRDAEQVAEDSQFGMFLANGYRREAEIATVH
jgi:hypothetical protein